MLIGRIEHATRDDFIKALKASLLSSPAAIELVQRGLRAEQEGAKLYFQGWDYSASECDAPMMIDHTGKMFQKLFKRSPK